MVARKTYSGLTALVLVVSAASAVQTGAAAAAPAHTPRVTGKPSAESTASRQARSSGKPVEVVADRQANATTFANPNGSFATQVTSAPTRVATGSGWKAIDLSLKASGDRLIPAESPSDVAVSGDGNGTLGSVSAGQVTVGLGWSTDLPDPAVDGATAQYALSAQSSLDVTARQDGFSANVVLQNAPTAAPVYRFPLHLTGATATLANGVLTFTDASGALVARSAALRMWDSQFDEGGDPTNATPISASLSNTAQGQVLELRPSMTYLTAPTTTYPVTVDPTISATVDDAGDGTYYSNDTTSPSDFSDSVLDVGYTTHHGAGYGVSALKFDLGEFVGRDVNSASLRLFQWDAGSCSNQALKIYAAASALTSDHTFAGLPAASTQSEWTQSPSFNAGKTGCSPESPNSFETADVTKILGGMTAGQLNRYGLLLKPPSGSEATPAYGKSFCSFNLSTTQSSVCKDYGSDPATTHQPVLTINWNSELGVQKSYSMTSHTLNDRSQLMINNEDGDAVIQADDVDVKGRGISLGLTRFYNGALDVDGQFGLGWTMSGGPDVQLSPGTTSDGSRFDYIGPGRTKFGRFVRHTSDDGSGTDTNTFWNPAFGGLDASLKDADGTSHPTGHHRYELTFNQSQEKFDFDNFGNDSSPAVLAKVIDRNNNEIDYTYNASNVWTGITDTHGRTYTVHHNTAGYVDSISDSYGRTWSYGYTGNQLTSYTDPTSATTSYGWTNGQVTMITDPAQAGAVHPTTTLSYSGQQTTGVSYAKDGSGGAYRFTFSYTARGDSSVRTASARCDKTSDAPSGGSRDKRASYSTDVVDVSDPRAGTTTYCFVPRDDSTGDGDTADDSSDSGNHDAYVRVIDGDGHRRSSQYNPDEQTTSATSATNDSASPASTVGQYNANNALDKVTDPDEGSGDTGATTYLKYNTPSSTAGSKWLPSSTNNDDGNCTSYSYDAKGNMSDSYTGLSGGSGNDCSAGGTKHVHVTYNSDGTIASTYTPSGAAAQADETVYTYFTTEPNKGELSKVIRPGGNTTCTTTRTLCTSYTYDSDSRALTVTDGNNNTSSYTYDADDRVTQLLLAGASSCTTSAGTCITYTYDSEGNLTQRVDKSGTTTFTYDRLNRLATETLPDGTVETTVYDGANNLTSYTQTLPGRAADTVTYTYDAANQLTRIVDATGTYAITNTGDGQRNTIAYPTTPAVTIDYDYTKSNRVKTITPTGGTGLSPISYSYKSGSKETHHLQTATTAGNTTSYTYGTDDRLTDASITAGTGTSYHYSYDADGNISTSQINSGATTYYGYNEADQLCWKGTTDGTRITRGCPTAPTGDDIYSSDAAGNNLGTSTAPITYNTQNQATSLTPETGGAGVNQTYTDQGNDLRITAGSTTITNASIGVTARTTTAGITYYTRDPQGHVIGQHGAGGTAYYYSDYLNNTVALITSAGAATTNYRYSPYGAATVALGSLDTPFRWTGAYQDIEGDKYTHLAARYSDNSGHFTQPDSVAGSISDPQTENLYAYAGGDPVNRTDPSGKCDGFEGCAGTGAAIGGFVGAIGGCAVGGLATGGIGCLPGGVIGLGEGAAVGTVIGGFVGLAEDIF